MSGDTSYGEESKRKKIYIFKFLFLEFECKALGISPKTSQQLFQNSILSVRKNSFWKTLFQKNFYKKTGFKTFFRKPRTFCGISPADSSKIHFTCWVTLRGKQCSGVENFWCSFSEIEWQALKVSMNLFANSCTDYFLRVQRKKSFVQNLRWKFYFWRKNCFFFQENSSLQQNVFFSAFFQRVLSRLVKNCILSVPKTISGRRL